MYWPHSGSLGGYNTEGELGSALGIYVSLHAQFRHYTQAESPKLVHGLDDRSSHAPTRKHPRFHPPRSDFLLPILDVHVDWYCALYWPKYVPLSSPFKYQY
jgi:hypothetical protein